MSRSTTNQLEYVLPDLSGLRCPICGAKYDPPPVLNSWVACKAGHWMAYIYSADIQMTTIDNSPTNVLYAEGK